MKTFQAKKKMILGIIFVALVIVLLFYMKSAGIFPDFSMIKMYRMDVEEFLMKNLLLGVLIFSAIYIVSIALSLPIATPLTVLSGFLFGNILGTGVVAFSATLGATGALLIIRFFFRDYVKEKFEGKLGAVNSELRGNGFRDILLLRLTPIVPFSLINIASALTAVRVKDFFLATLVGTLPFTFVYVNAGTQLAMIDSPGDIISLPILIGISLVVIAASIPLFIRRSRQSDSQNV